jgi:TPR repeat protein
MAQSYDGDAEDFQHPESNPDPEKVAWWLQVAADRGDYRAQSRVAELFQEGRGIKQDYAAAAKYYRMAASQGHLVSMYSLCRLYREGSGVKQDYSEAAKWCEIAAAHYFPDAQQMLGELYLSGQGVPQSNVEAYFWTRLANYWTGARESRPGPEKEEAIAKLLTPQQKDAVEKRVREWIPQDDPLQIQENRGHCENAVAEKRQKEPISDELAAICVSRCTIQLRITDPRAQSGPQCPYWGGPIRGLPSVEGAEQAPTIVTSSTPLEKHCAARRKELPTVPWREEKWTPTLQRDAENGDAHAQYLLAVSYFEGLGISRNYAKAAEWYRKVSKNSVWAQDHLGRIYADGGDGITRDYKEAYFWFDISSIQGNANAFSICKDVEGHLTPAEKLDVRRRVDGWLEEKRQAEQTAFQSLHYKAEGGDAKSEYELGEAYSMIAAAHSEGPKAPSPPEAITWYKRSAEHGYPPAQEVLSRLYEFGEGVPQDELQARKWMRAAAEQGFATAQYGLGDFYRQGVGGLADNVESYFWMSIACEDSHYAAMACSYRDGVGKDLTPEQLLSVSKRVKEWKPNASTPRLEVPVLEPRPGLVQPHGLPRE